MARPKSTLTKEQKNARAAEYQRLRRLAAKNVEAGIAPQTLPSAKTAADPIALEIERVRSKIAARGAALLQQAIAVMSDGKTVAEVMRSFVDGASHDPETEALVTLLASLQQAMTVRTAIASGNFNVGKGAVVADPIAKVKQRPTKKSRKRA